MKSLNVEPHALAIVPSLDELARDPSRAHGLSRPTRAELIARASTVIAILAAPMIAESGAAPEQTPGHGGDRLLNVDEAAAMLGCRRGWLYARARGLPFTVRPSPGQLRFSLSGIERFMRAKLVKGTG